MEMGGREEGMEERGGGIKAECAGDALWKKKKQKRKHSFSNLQGCAFRHLGGVL